MFLYVKTAELLDAAGLTPLARLVAPDVGLDHWGHPDPHLFFGTQQDVDAPQGFHCSLSLVTQFNHCLLQFFSKHKGLFSKTMHALKFSISGAFV